MEQAEVPGLPLIHKFKTIRNRWNETEEGEIETEGETDDRKGETETGRDKKKQRKTEKERQR